MPGFLGWTPHDTGQTISQGPEPTERRRVFAEKNRVMYKDLARLEELIAGGKLGEALR